MNTQNNPTIQSKQYEPKPLYLLLKSGKAKFLAFCLLVMCANAIALLVSLVGIGVSFHNIYVSLVIAVVCVIVMLPLFRAVGALMATTACSQVGLWMVFWVERIYAFLYGCCIVLPIGGAFAAIFMAANLRLDFWTVMLIGIVLAIAAAIRWAYHKNIAMVTQDIAASLRMKDFYLPSGYSCNLRKQTLLMAVLGLIPMAKSLLPTNIIDRFTDMVVKLAFSFEMPNQVSELLSASISVLMGSGVLDMIMPAVQIIAYFLIASLYKDYINAHYQPRPNRRG